MSSVDGFSTLELCLSLHLCDMWVLDSLKVVLLKIICFLPSLKFICSLFFLVRKYISSLLITHNSF